jgi:chromosomal replication initiator protein
MWWNEPQENQFYSNSEAVEAVKKIIFKITGIHFSEFNTNSRKRELVFARQLMIFMVRKHTSLNLIAIGQIFKRKYENHVRFRTEYRGLDHSTVIHAINLMEDILTSFARTREQQQIKNAIELWK